MVWKRRERGTPVPYSVRQVKLGDGSKVAVHSVDLGEAEVPDKTYFAVECGVDYARGLVRLMFCQPKLNGKSFRSMVLITMSPTSIANFSRSLEGIKDPSLEDIVSKNMIQERDLLPVPDEEPESTAELNANIAAIAIHGSETCLDFYSAGPFSHLHAQRSGSKELVLEPIVRITVGTAVMISLRNHLRKLTDQLAEQGEVAKEIEDAE